MHASVWARLSVAVTLSVLVHAALLFTPYLGRSASTSSVRPRGMHQPSTYTGINAHLVPEKYSAPAPQKPPAELAEELADARVPGDRVKVQSRPAANRSPGIGLLSLPATTYYLSSQLSKRPQPASEPELDTEETASIPAFGTVVLRLWIDARGEVTTVEIERSELPEIFSQTAANAFRNLRFVPGEREGQRVASVMRVEVAWGSGRMPLP